MSKVIALYRSSTDRQEVESQKKEVVAMAISDGNKKADIIAIGCAGASAIKLDKQYIDRINEVYRTIEEQDIKCVYAWAIDRIGRNEVVLMQFKNFMIQHKVQLKIRTMSTPLFNSDGEVDSGFELVYSFYATQAKQEMEQKQARFERARRRNMEAGKYNGGYIALGYKVNDNGYFEIDEEEANLIRLIFREFNSGNYSTVTLAKELNQRGYTSKGNIPFCSAIISRILNNRQYSGEVVDKKGRKKVFPAIISKEEQDKAKQILNSNNTKQTKSTKHYYFANKLIVCPECGHHFQVLNNCYQCSGAIMAKREGTQHLSNCQNNLAITFTNLDGILWDITKREVIIFVETDHSAAAEETKAKIAVLVQKIQTLSDKLSKYEDKINDIIENSDVLLLSEAQIAKRVANVRKAQEAEKNELNILLEEKERLEYTLNYSETFKRWLNGYGSLNEIDLNGDEKVMYDLVHQYISKITVERSEYNGNKNYQLITIEAKSGIYKIYYHGHKKVGSRAIIQYPEYAEGDFVDYDFDKVERTNSGITTAETELFKEFIAMLSEKETDFESNEEMWEFLITNDTYKKCMEKNAQRTTSYINEITSR